MAKVGPDHGEGAELPDQPTQELPDSVVDEIRRSSEAELAEIGYANSDSQTLDIIDNVLNQVREAVRSTGFERPPNVDSTNYQFEAEVDEPDDRIDIGTDHPAPQTGALERTPAHGNRILEAETEAIGKEQPASEQTMLDLRFVTELARKHGVAEAKYDLLARRLREAERSHGFERVELSDHLYGVYLDLQTAAAQFGSDDNQSISGMRRALGRVEALYQRLAEHSRSFRQEQGLPQPPPTGTWSSGSRQAIVEAGGESSTGRRDSEIDPGEFGEGSRGVDTGSASRSTFISPWSDPHGRSTGDWSSRRRGWRRRWPPARIARWTLVGILPLLLILWLFAASAEPVSRWALVDAPLTRLPAPIVGEVQPTTLHEGDRVEAGEVLLVITNDDVDTSRLEGLMAHNQLVSNRVEELVAERERLLEQQEGLEAERARWRQALLERLEHQLAEQEALVLQSESALANQQEALQSRRRELAEEVAQDREREGEAGSEDAALARAMESDPRVQSLLRIINNFTLRRDAQLAQKRRIEQRYRAVGEGIYQAGDQPPQDLRLAEVDRRLEEVRRQLEKRRAEQAEIAIEIANERAQVAKLRRAEVTASIDGVVWHRNASDGQAVTKDDSVVTLADHRDARIVAWMAKDAVIDVRTGMPVHIHLLGDGRLLRGRVVDIGEPRLADDSLAGLRRSDVPPGSVPMQVAIEDPDQVAQVLGQSAEVLVVTDEDPGAIGRLLLKFRMWLEF